jgi:hypothetical protein
MAQHPLSSPDLNFRIALREALLKLDGVQGKARTLWVAASLLSIVRDLATILIALEPDPCQLTLEGLKRGGS